MSVAGVAGRGGSGARDQVGGIDPWLPPQLADDGARVAHQPFVVDDIGADMAVGKASVASVAPMTLRLPTTTAAGERTTMSRA